MSVYLELISKNHYKVVHTSGTIRTSSSILKTILNYEYFYIPERNEVMFSSDKVEQSYLSNPQEKNICEVLIKNNINDMMFNEYIKQGINNIEYAIKTSNEIYLEHTLYVINALYCIYCFGLRNFELISQIGLTNGSIVFLLLSSFSKYGSERFLYNIDNIKKLKDNVIVIPFFLPYIYCSFIHSQKIEPLMTNPSVKLSIIYSLKLCESFNLNTPKEYTYANYLYACSNNIVLVPYFKEIALRCTPKKCTYYCYYYELIALYSYRSDMEPTGFVCSYESSWAYNKIKQSKDSTNSYKEMISNDYKNDNNDIIQIRNTGYTKLAFKL